MRGRRALPRWAGLRGLQLLAARRDGKPDAGPKPNDNSDPGAHSDADSDSDAAAFADAHSSAYGHSDADAHCDALLARLRHGRLLHLR